MKKLVLALIISLTLIGCGKSLTSKELQNRDGVFYNTSEGIPYTGKLVDYYNSGKIRGKGQYVNGKENGLWKFYSEDGKTLGKGNFENGELNGEWISYYENGQILEKAIYKNGKPNGAMALYHEDGRLYKMLNYIDGELIK